MISETVFMDCEGVPDEMCRFDRPWDFVGEVEGNRPYWEILCHRCCPKLAMLANWGDLNGSVDLGFYRVSLRGYLFITGDMIEVMVYFGVCEECDSIYWARQGPPFTRARCLVGVE